MGAQSLFLEAAREGADASKARFGVADALRLRSGIAAARGNSSEAMQLQGASIYVEEGGGSIS